MDEEEGLKMRVQPLTRERRHRGGGGRRLGRRRKL